jgi:hypothetical protein
MNQSLLKKLISGPLSFTAAKQEPEKKLYYEEKGHFIVGGAVDCNLTQGEEAFKTEYHLTEETLKKPSDVIMSIINMAFDEFLPILNKGEMNTNEFFNAINSHDIWNSLLHNACNNHNYYMNRKKETWQEDGRIDTVKKTNYDTYLKSLIDAIGKQILSGEETHIVNSMIMSFKTHPNTAKYFDENLYNNNDIDIYYQLPIYFEFFNVDCKALLDLTIVNHKDKTIRPLDIKTTRFEPYYFLSALKEGRYDIQAVFYRAALLSLTKIGGKLEGYVVLPFQFLVETTTSAMIGTPLVFTCSDDILSVGYNGIPKMYNFLQSQETNPIGNTITYKETKGLRQLFDDYQYYEAFGYEKRREVRRNGEFLLKWHEIEPLIPTQYEL